MSVLYNDVADGSINNQEFKFFEIDAVTIKTSMTEYHHLNKQSGLHLIITLAVYGGKWVTCPFSLFWST